MRQVISFSSEPTKDSRICPCQGQLEDEFKSSKVGSYKEKLEDILYFLQEHDTVLNFMIWLEIYQALLWLSLFTTLFTKKK